MASPDWLHSIRSELRELSRQVSQTRDLQQQILSQQATERAERQQFEYRIKNNVEQRLGNLEHAMHQFLKEHQSTVMFQHQLDHTAGRPTDAISSLVQATRTSPLTNHNLFQRVPLQSFRAEIEDKFGDSRSLTTFPADPLRPRASV
jgi:predicted transcriptional regulator